jgi:HEAT repeat protein
MHGYVTPEIGKALEKLLLDDDDDVRIASIEALAEVGEDMRERLLEAFIESDGRPRIRIAIAELFADREWPVKGYRPKMEALLPDGFVLNSKGLIRRRD